MTIKKTITIIMVISIFFIASGIIISNLSNNNYDNQKEPICTSNSKLVCDSYGNCRQLIEGKPIFIEGKTMIIGDYDSKPCQNITKPNPEYINNCCVDGICLNNNIEFLDTYTINNKTINLTECDTIPKTIIMNKTICHY